MPKVHPRPSDATAKELYANALTCGFPGCNEPLFVTRSDQTKRSLNSRMAHICARREGGPRWDPGMDGDENCSSANLILLCIKHADAIDLPENVDRYPVDLLLEWKVEQLRSYDSAVGGAWDLSDAEAAEVVAASESPSVSLQAETIFVGGIGGLAPGASGGGGGGIGPGAIGGPGGRVGRIELGGLPGSAPGSGGGGGGVIAPNAILPAVEPTATEGQGFSSGTDGQDGGDTIVSIGDIEVRAPGGQRGLAGTGVRLTDSRLAVSALMLVNYAEVRQGLASIVGGGWQSYSVLNLPTSVTFPVYVLFEAPSEDIGEYTVGVEVRGPDGTRRGQISFPLTVETAGDVVRIPRCCSLTAEVDAFGLWTVAAVTPERELARIDLLIKRTGQS